MELVHRDLIVPRICIHGAQQLMPCYCIYQLIYLGQIEAVIWACFIQVCEVDAGSSLSIGL